MSNTIKLKRGSGSDPSASDLVLGELAIRTDNGKIFLKKDNGSVAEVSGGGITDGDKGDITVSNSGGTFTIDSGVVTSAKIADDAVTNAKISSGAVGTTELDTGAITTAKLADDAVTNAKIGAGAVGTTELDTGAVTSAKIADGAIVNADINSSAAIAGTKIDPSFTSDITITNTQPKISLVDTNANDDFEIKVNAGNFAINDATNSANRFLIDSSGTVDINGNLDVGAGLDVTGEITATSHIDLPDDAKIKLGTGDDLSIFHNGSHSVIAETGTGNLQLRCADFRVTNADNSETIIVGNTNGAVELYHNNSKKFETKSDGVDITGELQCDSLDVDGTASFTPGSGNFVNFFGASNHAKWDVSNSRFLWDDNAKAVFGDSADLEVYHTGGGHSFVEATGQLRLCGTTNVVTRASAFGDVMINAIAGGAVELYENGTKRFETNTSGAGVVGDLAMSGELNLTTGGNYNRFIDSSLDNGEGLHIRSTNGGDANHQNMAIFHRQGSVELYHAAAKKFETATYGSVTTGVHSVSNGILELKAAIATSHTITTDYNALAVDPTINSGVTVTVPSGAVWAIV